MADNKPFSFEDFMKMRQEEIPSLLSKYRKKFDLTANTWMEDPAIYERAKQAASTDPNFAKALAMKGNDPTFTDTFIKKLDELVPQTSFEQAEKVAKSEIGGELSDLLSKRVENLRRTTIPEARTPDAEELIKRASRSSSPRILSESPSEVQKILGIDAYSPKELESVVGKSISEAQLDPASKYSSGRVIPGGSSQLEDILGVKPYTPKDIEFKGFDVVEGPQSPVSTVDKEGVKRDFLKQLAQDQFREGIESNRFQMMDEGPVSSPDAKEVRLRTAMEKNPASMVEGPATAPYPESSMKEGFKLRAADKFRAGLTNDFEALRPIVGDLTERLGRPPTGKEIMSALGEFGSKGASKLGELGLKGADKLTDVAGKVLTSKPVEFAGRKVIAPVATLVEGARTVGDIKRGKYGDALASGLGAASGIATMAGSPAALPLAAGSLSVTGAQEMGKQQAELADEGIFIDPLSGMARSEEELPESVRKAPMPVLKKAEPKPEEIELSTERTKEDEDIDAQIDQLMKDQESSVEEPETLEQEVLPEATPEEPGLELPEEPLSAVERKPSGLGDKLMDIVGLPSAYAADKPRKGEVPMFGQKTKKSKVPKHLMQNMVYSEAVKNKIPPALLLGLIEHESAGFDLSNPNVTLNKKSTARGLGQITAPTFEEVKKHFPEFRKMKHTDLSNLSNAPSLRNQIKASVAVLKVKAREAGIKWNEKNLNDPKVQNILMKRYFGNKNEQKNIEYAGLVTPKVQRYQSLMNKYEEKRKQNAAPKKESQSLLDRVLGGMSAVAREGRPLPEPKSTGMASLPFGPDVEGEDVQLASMDNPVSDEQSKIDEEINLLDQQIKSLEEPVEPKEEESSTIRLMQRLQEEGNEEKANKLMAMQNLLRAQSMTPIMKGMALAASGIVGAGPKKPFVTVPKLEGMETFDQLERAPASQLAMQKMLSEDKYEDPNSAVSEAYRKYAGEVLKKVDSNFDESRLAGLSANSIKTLLPMGIKEDSLLLRKLGMEGRKEKEQLATTLKQEKENRMLKKEAVAKFDRDTKDEKTKINGAIQAKALIKKIRETDPKDRLTASKNMRNTLTLEALRLATPAGLNVLAGDRAAAAIDTLYGDVKDKIGYLFSMPTETITDEYLDQLTTEIDLLKNKYKEFFVKKTNSILEAYDNPVQQKAVKNLASSYAPELYGEKLEGAEKPPVAEMAPAQDEMVKVQAPNGKMGKIPKSKLAQALKEGFKEVK
jgi:hypothetical protein